MGDLPEPALRYLTHSIAPGAPLVDFVEFEMEGRIRLKPDGSWWDFNGSTTLHASCGFIWRAAVKNPPIRGFDRYAEGCGDVNWKLAGWIPLVHADGPDVTRSAAGRYAGERIFLPSALLPERGVEWSAKGPNEAEAAMAIDGEPIRLSLTLAADGALKRVDFDRWSDGARRRFTVFVDEETRFGGYAVPSRFRAIWRAGEPEERFFFEARVVSARYG